MHNELVMPMTTATLRGRVALVTGASRGIGAAIVRRLADAGVAVAINYRERTNEANGLVKSISGTGGKAIAIAADVSQADAVAQLVQRGNSELGPAELLVNNAGTPITPGVSDPLEGELHRRVTVNSERAF